MIKTDGSDNVLIGGNDADLNDVYLDVPSGNFIRMREAGAAIANFDNALVSLVASVTDINPGSGGSMIKANGTGVGLYAATPVAQHSSTGETVGFTAGAGTGVNDDSTFTGNVGATAYRISDIVKALKNIGLIAS